MEKIRISAVKYANTYPFIYGLTESGFDKKVILETDHPADCAAKLISGRSDLGLIPVAMIPMLKETYIIGDYCIGANGSVKTVMLLSNNDFSKIDTIYLDYRSKTSVNLIKVLAKNSWNRKFIWVNTDEKFDFLNLKNNEAAVLIGDQCFEFEEKFSNRIDLAAEWKKFSGLPFVFACWTANRRLDENFIKEFNEALRSGVENIDKVVARLGTSGIIKGDELRKYLTENIDFNFDSDKKQGMRLFLELLEKL